jgi:hypothetical protein
MFCDDGDACFEGEFCFEDEFDNEGINPNCPLPDYNDTAEKACTNPIAILQAFKNEFQDSVLYDLKIDEFLIQIGTKRIRRFLRENKKVKGER